MNDIVTNYKGIFKFYYIKIINEIIKIGRLHYANGNILDFGCGEKQLQNVLQRKIINYDINPKYSEINDYKKLNYEVIVINQVFMYMTKKEIFNFLNSQKKLNKDVKIVVVISKHNYFGKILRKIFNKKKITDIKSTFNEQINVINKETIIKEQKNLFFNIQVFLLSF